MVLTPSITVRLETKGPAGVCATDREVQPMSIFSTAQNFVKHLSGEEDRYLTLSSPRRKFRPLAFVAGQTIHSESKALEGEGVRLLRP